jgi:ubiquinone/menaquinone biosynthesis C-methylase UbiE
MRARAKFDRFSWMYDLLEGALENRLIPGLRKQALGCAHGSVLELGIGTGKNIPLYTSAVTRVTGIDLSRGMLRKAGKRLQDARVDVDLRVMDAQQLEFEDQAFDTVVSTFVFCSVADPYLGLREARRVLKKNGSAVFLEHTRSDKPLVNLPLHLINAFAVPFLGDSTVRRTHEIIQSAGFRICEVHQYVQGVVRLVVAFRDDSDRS